MVHNLNNQNKQPINRTSKKLPRTSIDIEYNVKQLRKKNQLVDRNLFQIRNIKVCKLRKVRVYVERAEMLLNYYNILLNYFK